MTGGWADVKTIEEKNRSGRASPEAKTLEIDQNRRFKQVFRRRRGCTAATRAEKRGNSMCKRPDVEAHHVNGSAAVGGQELIERSCCLLQDREGTIRLALDS